MNKSTDVPFNFYFYEFIGLWKYVWRRSGYEDRQD